MDCQHSQCLGGRATTSFLFLKSPTVVFFFSWQKCAFLDYMFSSRTAVGTNASAGTSYVCKYINNKELNNEALVIAQ